MLRILTTLVVFALVNFSSLAYNEFKAKGWIHCDKFVGKCFLVQDKFSRSEKRLVLTAKKNPNYYPQRFHKLFVEIGGELSQDQLEIGWISPTVPSSNLIKSEEN